VLVHPVLEARGLESVETARALLARVTFQTSANDAAKRASAGRYLLHTLSNVARLARESDVAALAGLATGVPAIIAAAGPSLDRNIHDIAPVRDRALLIACDTAARPLVSVDLDPDFIVAADPSRVNAAHLASLPQTRAWLVAEGSLHPSAFVNFDRRTFIFSVANHQPWPWLASIGLSRGHLPTWGSVATSAFSLALLMGCDPIVFSGADFAFTGNRPYCRGTSFEPLWSMWVAGGGEYDAIWRTLVDRWPEATAPGIDGAPVRTGRHLLSFRDWIRDRAAASGRRVVNATGAGVLVGDGLTQSAAAPLLFPHAPLSASVVHETIRRAHSSAIGDLARALAGIDAVLDSPNAETMGPWRSFAGATVTAAAIQAALRSPEHTAWTLRLERLSGKDCA
jgi:hypothetical protein